MEATTPGEEDDDVDVMSFLEIMSELDKKNNLDFSNDEKKKQNRVRKIEENQFLKIICYNFTSRGKSSWFRSDDFINWKINFDITKSHG